MTQQQSDIFKFICKAIDSEGFPPSLTEIGNATGYRLRRPAATRSQA